MMTRCNTTGYAELGSNRVVSHCVTFMTGLNSIPVYVPSWAIVVRLSGIRVV